MIPRGPQRFHGIMARPLVAFAVLRGGSPGTAGPVAPVISSFAGPSEELIGGEPASFAWAASGSPTYSLAIKLDGVTVETVAGATSPHTYTTTHGRAAITATLTATNAAGSDAATSAEVQIMGRGWQDYLLVNAIATGDPDSILSTTMAQTPEGAISATVSAGAAAVDFGDHAYAIWRLKDIYGEEVPYGPIPLSLIQWVIREFESFAASSQVGVMAHFGWNSAELGGSALLTDIDVMHSAVLHHTAALNATGYVLEDGNVAPSAARTDPDLVAVSCGLSKGMLGVNTSEQGPNFRYLTGWGHKDEGYGAGVQIITADINRNATQKPTLGVFPYFAISIYRAGVVAGAQSGSVFGRTMAVQMRDMGVLA